MEPAFMTQAAFVESCERTAASWQNTAAYHSYTARYYMDRGLVEQAKYNQSAARDAYNHAARFMASLGMGAQP